MEIFEGASLGHNRLMRRFDQNGRGAPHRGRSTTGCRRKTKEASVARGDSWIVLKLEVDLPEASIVTDGCEVLAARKRRRV